MPILRLNPEIWCKLDGLQMPDSNVNPPVTTVLWNGVVVDLENYAEREKKFRLVCASFSSSGRNEPKKWVDLYQCSESAEC